MLIAHHEVDVDTVVQQLAAPRHSVWEAAADLQPRLAAEQDIPYYKEIGMFVQTTGHTHSISHCAQNNQQQLQYAKSTRGCTS